MIRDELIIHEWMTPTTESVQYNLKIELDRPACVPSGARIGLLYIYILRGNIVMYVPP